MPKASTKLKTTVFVVNRRMRAGIKKDPKNAAEACTICEHLIPVNTPQGIGYECDRKKCRFSMG